ncbi:MAG: monovalent cation/H(+) antiporter subunit G [Desulfobulbaceae bacterium]|nr:MAG: monovalent cation/H(+) antiporter subunit G [Desulfobulbaceae bacterium]
MELVLDIISWIFLVTGCFFCLTGAVGLLRFPDFFSRIHAASITDTLGAGLILIGLMFQSGGWGLVMPKLVLILLFSLLASTTASHAIAKAALKSGLKPEVSSADEPSEGESSSKL